MRLYIHETDKKGTIEPEIYGHFSEHLGRCIYGGLYVGEDSEIPNVNGMRTDVVDALRKLQVPVLRWPGGCFADEYHWEDGIGPKEQRRRMVNSSWGGDVEDNRFGTHEFFELCRQIGCKPYICGNVGSGTVREMSDWVEYMTAEKGSTMAELRRANGQEKPWRLDYFGVGNENWGCGGNMVPEYYAHLYRRYQTFVRTYDRQAPIARICGGANADDYDWTERVFRECFREPAPREAHGYMDGYSVHYYCGAEKGLHKGSATEFAQEDYWYTLNRALGIEELIRRHGAIMDRYDPQKRIGMMIDEWGCWHDAEPGTNPDYLYQQNTMRDAMVAALTLNIFNRHCDRVRMACIAQIVNVLQSVILTDGPELVLTPTWYVFHMYRTHQGASLVPGAFAGEEMELTGDDRFRMPQLQQSASVDADGVLTVTLANVSLDREARVEVLFDEREPKKAAGTLLHGRVNAYNSFEQPDVVHEEELTGLQRTERGVNVTLPPCSIAAVRIL